MTQGYKTRKTCRACKGNLTDVFDLGVQVINNFDGLKDTAPLCLTVCDTCGLHQLRHTVPAQRLYNKNYGYRSSQNPTMVKELKSITDDIESMIDLKPEDTVLDIGCNDGTLLDSYKTQGLFKVGYDPAGVNPKIDIFKNTVFSAKTMPAGKVKVVTTIAMFYDLEDPHSFIQDIIKVLRKDGVWVIQLMDLVSMLKSNGFDNICHEHLEYYTLRNIVDLMEQNGLTVQTVKRSQINGGSLRVFVGYGDRDETVKQRLYAEKDYLENGGVKRFITNVENAVRELRIAIQTAHRHKRSVAALGASTKANTLLQYAGLGPDDISCVGEINQDKVGKQTVTGIPIVYETEALAFDVVVILIWQFSQYLADKHSSHLHRGGSFIIPLPECKVIPL